MITDRVLQIIEYKGISKSRFYKETGLSNGFLDKVKDIGASKVEDILNTYPEIDIEWLLTGKGRMLKAGSASNNLLKESSGNYSAPSESEVSIPLIPIDAMAGFGNGHTTQIMEYDTERYVIPEFNELNVEFLIRMKGSSMIPKYNSGDLLGCRRLPMDSFFQWNKVYVIDTVQGALVKRVHKSEKPGHIICVSDNENYPPFELSFDTDVNAIAIVLGVIRFE